MAGWPYEFHGDFETGWDGTNPPAGWDSLVDEGVPDFMDFPHYTELAGMGYAPFEGAYTMRQVRPGGTATRANLNNAISFADGETHYIRYSFLLHTDVTSGGVLDDLIFMRGGSTEMSFGVRLAADGTIQYGHGRNTLAQVTGFNLERGVWYTAEHQLTVTVPGGGTVDSWITRDGDPASETVSMTQASAAFAAILSFDYGTIAPLATTSGTFLLGPVTMSETGRIYPRTDTWKTRRWMGKGGHAFVGPGTVCDVQMTSGSGTDNVIEIWDTDTGDTSDDRNLKHRLANTAADEIVNQAAVPFHVRRGCYVTMSPDANDDASDPQALLSIKPRYYGSRSEVVRFGLQQRSQRFP